MVYLVIGVGLVLVAGGCFIARDWHEYEKRHRD
jgi:hypothetical protein